MTAARICDHCGASASEGCTVRFKSVEIVDEKSRYESFQGGSRTTSTTAFRDARDETCWICEACLWSHQSDLTRASLQVPITLMVLSGLPLLAFLSGGVPSVHSLRDWACLGVILLTFFGAPIVLVFGWLRRRTAVATAIRSGTLDETKLGDSAWCGTLEEGAKRSLARSAAGSPRRAYSRAGYEWLVESSKL